MMVGKGSDRGGCSTMGTLSGGGNIISVGEECLVGAMRVWVYLWVTDAIEAGFRDGRNESGSAR